MPEIIEYTSQDGLKLRGDAYGNPDAQPVLLLHGGGQTRNAWGDTAIALGEKGFRAISMDLRGHGESDWAPDESHYAIDSFIEDARTIVSSFSKPPIMVGASLGGIISIGLQGESDIPITKAIVLVDVAPRLEEKGVERIRTFMEAHHDGFDSIEHAADIVAKYLNHRERPTDFSRLEKNLRLKSDGRYHWHWDPAMLRGLRIKKIHNQARLHAAGKNLKVPVLFMRGTLSDVVTREIMNEFVHDVPHAETVEIEGAGHTIPGDSNEKFTDALLAFLKKLEATRSHICT
jgi:pimeloyl-ACP methyl ester carboxylesterase